MSSSADVRIQQRSSGGEKSAALGGDSDAARWWGTRGVDKAPSVRLSDMKDGVRERSTPPLSVVICTRNRPDTIGRAVESVATQPCSTFEVVVVDQSETDETRKIVTALGARYAHVRYVHVPQPGLSRASNVGMRESTGEVLAFTDDDCVAPPTWLPTIAARFAAAPDIAMLYGQVLLPQDVPMAVDGSVIPALGIPERRRLSQRDGFKIFGMGANFAVRRDAFERINGFDEVLGGGGPLRSSQDFDFAYRIFRSGGTILLEPDVYVYHYGKRSRSQWPATLSAYGTGDGGFYFKHVRVGDFFALRLLLRVLAGETLRSAKRTVRRDPGCAGWPYMRGIVTGIRTSLRFDIDRANRLYCPQPSR
jgi:glycosyltransferase involved in cell wall biosynthesis